MSPLRGSIVCFLLFYLYITPMEFFIYEARRAEIIVIKPLKQNHRNPEGVALLFKVLFVTHQNRYRTKIANTFNIVQYVFPMIFCNIKNLLLIEF